LPSSSYPVACRAVAILVIVVVVASSSSPSSSSSHIIVVVVSCRAAYKYVRHRLLEPQL
jgi:hypothetical protein